MQEKKLSPCPFGMGGWKTKQNLHEFSSLLGMHFSFVATSSSSMKTVSLQKVSEDNTGKESSASSSCTTRCNTSGCSSIWNLTVLWRFLLLCTPFFSSLSDSSPWLADECGWGEEQHDEVKPAFWLFLTSSFGITTRWVILLWFVIWEDGTLLFIIFYIFLSSNVCTTWAANFIVFSFLFVFLSSNVCITWAATFPASFFQRFILCCLSLSFSSCLFLPDLLYYLFPYLFICGTVKVLQISSTFNSKKVDGISQYNYFSTKQRIIAWIKTIDKI